MRDKDISTLWEQFTEAIDRSYASRNKDWSEDPRHELRDYATNESMFNALERMVDAETATERQHRNARPYQPTNRWYVSQRNAAKLLLMSGAADIVRDWRAGKKDDVVPSGLRWLRIRRTIAEAELLGFIAREYLTTKWADAVKAIDYTTLHN
jgi:hypothetical protein